MKTAGYSLTDMRIAAYTYNKKDFNDDISGWDVSKVTDMMLLLHGTYPSYQ